MSRKMNARSAHRSRGHIGAASAPKVAPRKGVMVELRGTREAIDDPYIGPEVFRMAYAALQSTESQSTVMCECYLCARRWTEQCGPVVVAVIQTVGIVRGMRGLAGLCERCADSPDVWSKVIATVGLDFRIPTTDVREVSCQAGRA